MKRAQVWLIVIMVCCAIIAGQEGDRLGAQEVSLIAPGGAAQADAEVARAYLGLTFEPNVRDAAIAQSITPGSPADLAGLRSGDAIETLNGQHVASYQDVLDAVRWMKPGDSIDIVASRRVSIRTQAVLGRAPEGYRRAVDRLNSPDSVEQYPVRPAAAEELLPAPAVFPNRAQAGTEQFTTNALTQRGYQAIQNVGRSENGRASQQNNRERGSRNRGLFRRRN